MSEQTEIVKRKGKRGKLPGTRDYCFIKLESLLAKFNDMSQQIPVNRKFCQLMNLSGTIQETPQHEVVKVEETKSKIDVSVVQFE